MRDTSWQLNAKLQIVDEECDECVFWLEVIEETRPPEFATEAKSLLAESRELRAIFGKAKGTFGEQMG